MHARPFPALILAIVFVAVPAAAQTVGQGAADTPQATTVEDVQAPTEPVHPAPAHAGWKSLVKDTAQDFVAFPKRKSTSALLAAGATGALVAHQADDYVESHVVGKGKAENFFALGQWLGSAYVQVGASVGLWAVGRYIVAPAADEPRTNKWSHVGFDLMRARIVSQALVHAMNTRFAGIVRQASAARFRPGTPRRRLRRRRCSSGTLAIADRGPCWQVRPMSRRRALSTTGTF